MTSFVYDFKDIATRMKGELKAFKTEEEVLVKAASPQARWRLLNTIICKYCHGYGRDTFNDCCIVCNGKGTV